MCCTDYLNLRDVTVLEFLFSDKYLSQNSGSIYRMNKSTSKKIYVVDDNLIITEVLKDYLVDQGHQVKVFPTGEDCLAELDEKPDIIILDYLLNSVNEDAADGVVILKQIKAKYPDMRVIMLSSLSEHKDVNQAVELGAEEFVYKDQQTFEKIVRLLKV